MDPVRVPSIPAASFMLPPRLEGLRRLAYNLHWAWHPRTRGLFDRIDSTGWARYRSPIPVISGAADWPHLLDDAKFLAEYHDVLAEFDAYMANGSDHWFQRKYPDRLSGPIAYFCAEYGFHESLGIYSGVHLTATVIVVEPPGRTLSGFADAVPVGAVEAAVTVNEIDVAPVRF